MCYRYTVIVVQSHKLIQINDRVCKLINAFKDLGTMYLINDPEYQRYPAIRDIRNDTVRKTYLDIIRINIITQSGQRHPEIQLRYRIKSNLYTHIALFFHNLIEHLITIYYYT